jgi:excisionase family DNA binding protein
VPKHRTMVPFEEGRSYIGCSERHLRALVYRRDIPYHKVGRLVFFDLDDLDAWLDANRVEAVAS